MQGLLSPKVDFVFKRIFGNEQHPEVLVSFLNAVINEKDEIKSVKINNTEIDKESIIDKHSRLDIKATTNSGTIINIEMQMKNEHNIDERTLYYWSKMYEGQLQQRGNYKSLKRTICINLLNYSHIEENEDFHNVFRLKNVKTNAQLTDICEIHFIELPKYNKSVRTNQEEQEMIEKWLSFINQPQKYLEEKPKEKEIKIAVDYLTKMSASDTERERYEKRQESILEYNSFISTKKSIEKNLKQERQQGIEQGLKQGIKQGIERGIELERKELAESLLDILDNETIAIKTKLTLEEIVKLREEAMEDNFNI